VKYYQDVPRAQRRAVLEVPADAHGTLLGYFKFACLCDGCRAYARDYRRARVRDRELGRTR
jgi:hypothetical protein